MPIGYENIHRGEPKTGRGTCTASYIDSESCLKKQFGNSEAQQTRVSPWHQPIPYHLSSSPPLSRVFKSLVAFELLRPHMDQLDRVLYRTVSTIAG